MFSTISSWALLIWKALESCDCDPEPLFEKAGVDVQKLGDANTRISVPAMQRLWGLAVEVTGDPCFGLKVHRFWHPTTMHALGYSWLASHTLREALERTARYIRIVSSAAEARLETLSDHYRFVLVPAGSAPQPLGASIDAGLAVILDMCRTSYGNELNPLRVEMHREVPSCAAQFDDFFKAPIDYAAAENAFVFDKVQLEEALPTANAELARANDKIVTEYLAHLDRSNVAMQVKALLIEHLPSGGASEEAVARALHKSLRSLQRRLKEQGTSYKQLLEETRRELAGQYIANSQYSISEITYLLGFSETSNFSRAFKRWTGKSPSAYREAG